MATIAADSSVLVYQFHVLLLDISPAIWRRVLLRSDSTVADLHYTLQILMGWGDDHLHRFVLHGKAYGLAQVGGIDFADDPQQVRLRDWHLRPKERFRYEYDFHANWQHQLRLEQILPLPARGPYPRCIGGARQAPPAECNGAAAFLTRRRHYSAGYIQYRVVEILEELLEHREDEYDAYEEHLAELRALCYWAKQEQFDRRAINRRLRQYAAGAAPEQWLVEEDTDETESPGDA